MLQKIVATCVHRRFAVVLAALAVAVYGIQAYLRTSIEAFPDVTNVQITVIAQAPGLAPEEVERQVTVPLERALNGMPGMLLLRSESLFALSLVTLTFEDDADNFRSRMQVAERARTADLPDGVLPELAPDDTPLGEIYQFRVAGERYTPEELRAELQWTVTRVLLQVPGVADVVTFGGYLKELHVEVDPARLIAHKLSLAEVTEAIEKSNLNVGGGFLRHGDQELTIRSVGYLENAEDVKNIVLRSENGTPVTVGDVARVVQSHTPRRGSVGQDLDPEVAEGFVLLRRGENPSDVLEGVHAKVADLNGHILPQGMRIEPFYDRSRLVGQTLSTVHENLLHGALLIIGVIWLFLRSWRASLIVAVVIPLAVLAAFIGLHALGLPANLISMGAIDFGILVDGAVILVENVMHEAVARRPENKRALLGIVTHAALDVSRPTFYAMAIIVASLIPVFTLQRVEGRIFRPLALTYTFALTGALIFALTVVPALCALALRPKDVSHGEPKFVQRMRQACAVTLRRLVARRPLVLALGFLVLALGALVGSRLGTEFLPELDEGDMVIFVEMPPSIALDAGQGLLLEVRRRLLAFPEVAGTLSEQGRPEDGTDNEGVNMSETFVRFRPAEQWRPGWTSERLVDAMRNSLSEIPGVRFNFSQPIKDNVEESVSGVRGKVVLKIFGEDLEAMRSTLERAIVSLKKVRGVVDLDLYRDTTVPQLQIKLDRGALARNGISVGTAQELIETALAGKIVSRIWEGEKLVPVRVLLPASERDDATRIGEILLPAANGRVPLNEVASLSVASGRASINREANSRFMALKFNVEGRDMGSAIQESMAVVEHEVKPPDRHFFQWGGEFENQQRAMARLAVIVPISLIAVLGLLYGALGTGRAALAIVLSAPFAMTGGVFAAAIAHVVLSVSAAIGFIALLGQISLAGLLVIGAIEAARRRGETREEAVVTGAVEKVRALVMTALLAILGLMPMVVSSGVGSETERPFATVLVGGMFTTLGVALFLLPVIYSFIMPRELPQPEEEMEV